MLKYSNRAQSAPPPEDLKLGTNSLLPSPLEGEGAVLNELANVRNAGEGFQLNEIATSSKSSPLNDILFAKQTVKNHSPFTTHNSLKFAFTLAETLITLGIIGIVAALTVPQLISKYNEKVTIHKVEVAYSLLSNAYNALLAEYGTPDSWEGISSQKSNYDNTVVVVDLFSKKLKITDPCQTVRSNCHLYITNTQYGPLTGVYKTWNLFDIATKMNDMTVIFSHQSATCRGWSMFKWDKVTKTSPYYHACGNIYVDINGSKRKPNRFGKDLFEFIYIDSKIVPLGTPPTPYYNLSSSCNPNLNKSWDGSTNGDFCTAWILIKKNMDYLRKEVQW